MRVTQDGEVRDAECAKPGQQQQTVQAANLSLMAIEDATAVVMLSFVPKDGGGYIVEVGVAGTGPLGFGATVAGTLHAAADIVGPAMDQQGQRVVRARGRS